MIAFRKNIRAKESPIIALTPLYFKHIAACSREEPHPKLFPATIMPVFFIISRKFGRVSAKVCVASSSGLFIDRYRPGMISSVLILS